MAEESSTIQQEALRLRLHDGTQAALKVLTAVRHADVRLVRCRYRAFRRRPGGVLDMVVEAEAVRLDLLHRQLRRMISVVPIRRPAGQGRLTAPSPTAR